jgi:Putative Ig domain
VELDESYSIVLQVQFTPLQITTPSLPNGQVGVVYNCTLQAAGGTPPYVWTLVSAIPDTGNWLACSGAGVLSGTPGTSEAETVTVRVQDSSPVHLQTQATYGFTVNPSQALQITTASPLPQATVGSAYSQTLTATGGTTPYTWSLLSAAPNTGNWLSINATGHVLGTPGTAEVESLTAQVLDSSAIQQSAQKTFSLTVQSGGGGPLTILTTSPLPTATVGSVYSTTMAATGGTTPYTWSIVSDAPDTGSWLSINAGGILSGTPGTVETETVVIKVTDAVPNSAQGTFTLPVQASSGSLTITTNSLANAIVGSNYSAALAASGGTAPYSWNLVSAIPNTDLWLSVSGANLVGIPELTDNMTVIVQVNDSVGHTAQAQFSFVCTVSGALSIVKPTGIPNYYTTVNHINGIYALRMLAAGGQPPYYWSFSGNTFVATGTTGTLYAMSNFGWLMGATTVSSGTDTLTVLCTDVNGATATQTVTATATPGLQFYPIDSVSGVVNLPTAWTSTAYQTQLRASGGSGTGYVYSAVSGLPAGLSMSSSGLITGAPKTPGSAQITIKVQDSVSNLTTALASINVLSQDIAARPAYNTGAGFFVDPNGRFRDSIGAPFPFRGHNRAHYDSASWAGPASGALTAPATVRVFMFDGSTAAFAANQITTQYQPNNIFTWLVLAGITATNSWGTWSNQGTSGQTSTPLLTQALADWVSYQSTLAPVQNVMGVNVANEWGAGGSATWQQAYQYVSGNVSGAAGNTVTVNTVVASNPFANSPMCYIGGAGGITNQVLLITGTGGVSGAWTVTVTLQGGGTLSGYTSGGTLYGGAVGVLRGAGYLCPIMIDTGSSGEDYLDILNFSVAVNNSDPQKNCVFAIHPYQTSYPFQGLVQSITKGNPTVLTLASNSTLFPLNPGASTAGNDNFIDQYTITGALGVTQMNGTFPANVHTFGSAGAWQVQLTVDSTAWTGTYTAGSATILPASTGTGGRSLYYQLMAQQLAALRSSGVCAIFGEFGPGNQLGTPAVAQDGNSGRANLNSQQVAPGQIISAAESYAMPWQPWAWDDHSATVTFPAQFANSWFAEVLGNNGVYTANSQFTAYGLDMVANPRYGLWARSTPASSFLTLVPLITALPSGASTSAPWTAFLAATGGYASWATNTPYTDNTGAVLRRITNRSTIAGGGEFVMEYAEGGPKVSQPLGGGQYWIACLYGTSGSHSNYFVKYQIGLGYVAGSVFPSPVATTGLNVSFSMLPGEASICYIADNNSTIIHRYDCNAQAYAPNSVFNGVNASINCGVAGPGWCATSWDGSTLTFQAPYAGPTAIFSLNVQTGVLKSYTGSATSAIMPTGIVVTSATPTTITVTGAGWATIPGNGQWDGAQVVMTSGAANGKSATVNSNTASVLSLAGSISPTPSPGDTFRIYNVNELHVMHGQPSVVWLEDNNSESSLPYAWFPATGFCTAAVGRTVNQYGGHSDAGATNLYTMNPNAGQFKILNEYTPGNSPAADGGAWTGTQTNYWGLTAATEPDDTGGHFNISWAQPGAGVNEWATRDSFGEPYNAITANSWTVQSGQIYKTTTSGNTRPISGILLWNGTIGVGSQITGSLSQVGALGSVVAGTFYTDGTTTYAWLSAGGSPSGKVILRAGGLQTDRIAYYKQDGSQIRTLCWLYYEPQDAHNVYYHNGGYANVSPDGYICVFASDLGTYSGFADLIVAEVPLT